jgi:hypothetical protein
MEPPGIRVNVGMILPKLLGAALGAALLFAPAARADVLDPVDGEHLAAQDGTRVWNHVDADHHYSLVNGDDGTTLATTGEQYEPFDVSLGTDNEGRLLAVYSRCDGIHCKLYAYDMDAGTELALGIEGTSPSLSHGVLAFARDHDLYQSRLGTKPRRIAHVNGMWTQITAVSASARGVAFVAEDSDVANAMYLKPAGGGKLRRLAFSRFDSEHFGYHLSPVWHGGRLYWAFSNHMVDSAGPNGWVMRYDVSSRRVTAARVSPGYLDAVAFDGSTLITSVFFDDESGQVATLDAPHWGRPPALAGVGH